MSKQPKIVTLDENTKSAETMFRCKDCGQMHNTTNGKKQCLLLSDEQLFSISAQRQRLSSMG